MSDASTKHWPKLNLALSPQAFSLLEDLVNASGQNTAQVLKTGLALYGIAVDAAQEGKQLAIAKNERVQQTIQLPNQDRSNIQQKAIAL